MINKHPGLLFTYTAIADKKKIFYIFVRNFISALTQQWKEGTVIYLEEMLSSVADIS